jgi:hypothetical protein
MLAAPQIGHPIYEPAPYGLFTSSTSTPEIDALTYRVNQLMALSGANAEMFRPQPQPSIPSAATETLRASGPASLQCAVTLVDTSSAKEGKENQDEEVVVTLPNGTEGQSKTVLLAHPLTRCRIVTRRGSALLDGSLQCARFTFAGGRWYLLADSTGPASATSGPMQALMAYRAEASPLSPQGLSGFRVAGVHTSYTGNSVWAWSADGEWCVWTWSSARGVWEYGRAASPNILAVPGVAAPGILLAGVWFHAGDTSILYWALHPTSGAARLAWCPLDEANGLPRIAQAVVTDLGWQSDWSPSASASAQTNHRVGTASPGLDWAVDPGMGAWVQNPATRVYAYSAGLSASLLAHAPGRPAVAEGGKILTVTSPGRVSLRSVAQHPALAFGPPTNLAIPPDLPAAAGFGLHAVGVSPSGRTVVVALNAGVLAVYVDGGTSVSAVLSLGLQTALDSLVVRDNVILAGSRADGCVWTLLPQEGGARPGLAPGWQPVSAVRGRDTARDPDFGAMMSLSQDGTTLVCPGSLGLPGPLFLFS